MTSTHGYAYIDGTPRRWQNGTVNHRQRLNPQPKETFMAAVLPPLVMILLVALIVYLAWRQANKEE